MKVHVFQGSGSGAPVLFRLNRWLHRHPALSDAGRKRPDHHQEQQPQGPRRPLQSYLAGAVATGASGCGHAGNPARPPGRLRRGAEMEASGQRQ